MLVNVDVFNVNENRWEVNGLMPIESAFKIYPFDETLEMLTMRVDAGYPEYGTAGYEKTFWDPEFEEYFTVEITKPLRITKHK